MALATTIAVIAVVNYLIAQQAVAAIARQNVIDIDRAVPYADARKPSPRSLIAPFGLAAVVIGFTFMPSRLMRETISGGYLVLQLSTFVMTLDSLARMRALGRAGAADGRVHFSTSYRFRASAGQAFALGLLNAAIAWLFGSVSFLVGSLFVLATALGWYRRAVQTTPRVRD